MIPTDPTESRERLLSQLTQRRSELAQLDRTILDLVARRQSLVSEIGLLKEAAGLPARDYAQEKEVASRARAAASELGLAPDLAERLVQLLIRSSLMVQEQHRVQSGAVGSGRRALIIGGAGKMGRWLARFMASQGHAVEIADPNGSVEGFIHHQNWELLNLDHDLIAVAAPLRPSARILEELARRAPPGVVFDIGSLKTPLRAGLQALRSAGVRVTSIHPMFGPDTELLSGRHVIFVDLGVPEATERVRQLFASTMAIQVDMDLDSHDRLVAYILGLSHALNIAFFTALAESGEDAAHLAQLSSTTFDAQIEVARRVASENPRLYFEIQALNDFGLPALEALRQAVERLHSIVARRDEEAFAALMQQGERYLHTVPERST
jgi:chorismate mutase/prephenate dehydrogenase